MKKIIISVIAIILSINLISCKKDEASITVTNKIGNIKIDNINWSGMFLGSGLLPGESTYVLTLTEDDIDFPKTSHLEFYMYKKNKRVFLKTRAKYTLKAGDKLEIIIDDTTKVYNPAYEY